MPIDAPQEFGRTLKVVRGPAGRRGVESPPAISSLILSALETRLAAGFSDVACEEGGEESPAVASRGGGNRD